MIKPVLHYYDIAEKGITAFTTTRHGGESKGTFGELNINAHRGDCPEAVKANLKAVAKELGVEESRIIRQHQVHETECRQIAEEFFSLPESVQERIMEGSDAMMTHLPNTCIGVFTADCTPILLYDPVKRCIAAIHAGWRGTVKHIAMLTVLKMRKTYGTDPNNLRAIIGPCISEKNFEVGDEVYQQFVNAGYDMKNVAEKREKWHINLPLCNELDLQSVGVNPHNIHQSGICTYDTHNDYFSARRIKENFGTSYTGIILR